MSRLGLTVQDVENQLTAALYGQIAGTISEQDRLTNIRVRYPDRVRYDRENWSSLPISLPAAATPDGTASCCLQFCRVRAASAPQFVPLGQLATIELVRSPNEFWRENQQPVITVTAEPGDQDLGTINRELEARLVAHQVSRPAIAGNWPAAIRPSKIRSPAC